MPNVWNYRVKKEMITHLFYYIRTLVQKDYIYTVALSIGYIYLEHVPCTVLRRVLVVIVAV